MKLYYSKGACSLAVRIAMHEMGIPAEFEAVDLVAKRTESGADYWQINGKGAVPALLLDDKTVLTENAVIQQYLADKEHATRLLPPVGDKKRYQVLEWLNYVSTELHKGFGPFFNPNLAADVKENIFKPNFLKKLDFVDKHLEHNTYLLGEEFTLPDGYLFVMLMWLKHIKLDVAKWPHLNRYFEKLKERKSIKQALQEEGLSK